MEYVGVFLLSWLIIAVLVALIVGRMFRETNSRDDRPAIPLWRPERRLHVRRGHDRGVEVPWHQVDQRHGFGRRHSDRPRKVT